MRWSPPSERTQMILLSPVLLALMPVFLPMVGFFWAWERWGPEAKFRRWFAWRPVKAECVTDDGCWTMRWVWLETIEKFSGAMASTAYRIPADKEARAHD